MAADIVAGYREDGDEHVEQHEEHEEYEEREEDRPNNTLRSSMIIQSTR